MNRRLGKSIKEYMLKAGMIMTLGVVSSTVLVQLPGTTTYAAIIQNQQKGAITTNGSTVSIANITKSKEGKYYVTINIENKEGLPAETTNVMGFWRIRFKINNTQYFMSPIKADIDTVVTKATNNKITYTVEAKCEEKTLDKNWEKSDIDLRDIKGKKAYLTLGSLYLTSQKDILKESLSVYAKEHENPTVMSFDDAGIKGETYDYILKEEGNTQTTRDYINELKRWDEQNKPKNVLKSQGLNIKPCTDTSVVLDSIGFVDGKLHIISTSKGYDGLRLEIKDSQGNSRRTIYTGKYNDKLEYQVYDIKSIEELNKLSIKCIRYKLISEEKMSKLDNKTEIIL